MRRYVTTLVLILAATALWYGAWHSMLAADVARIKTSIDYQNQQFKTVSRDMVFKAESVEAAGFPFHFRIRVTRPTLSIIDGQATYAISIPQLLLEPTDSAQGRYRVELPATFDALYATNGAAPENYIVTMDKIPQLAVRAQADSQQCSNFPGTRACDAVKPDAPIITYAVQVPHTITLHMQLRNDARDAAFTLTPLDIPIFQTIPTDMTRPLELFVGILREALVFKTQ